MIGMRIFFLFYEFSELFVIGKFLCNCTTELSNLYVVISMQKLFRIVHIHSQRYEVHTGVLFVLFLG